MPKLFLVGITPDHRALVLSEHARAKRGDMVLEIDDRLLEAIDKAQRLRTFDEGNRLESAALPSKREAVNGDGTEIARLTPREIQQRLRAGESITALARSSGTDEAWIRRFAAPVLAEQAKVIEQARTVTFTKRGVGPSAVTLGPAVAGNVIDRGVPLTLPELEAAWGAHQRPEGGWHVTFTFPLRGRRQTAEWEIDLATGNLTARNKLASDLGWREAGKKLPQPKPAKVAAPKPAVAAAPSSDPGPAPGADREQSETPQLLPLTDEAGPAPPAGPARRAPSARKAPPAARKTPAARKPAPTAKRTAAAVTEAPARSVVPVPPLDAGADAGAEAEGPARPAGSMPPTDLDVVDVPGGFPLPDDDERETVIVLPQSPEDEAVEPPRAAGTAAGEPGASLDDDGPTGPISLAARPQPAPLGAQPAPQGGPPAP
jgi:hypothetical protein